MEAIEAKIHALLNKAEHPNTSPVEAEIFFAKAAQLMADNAIDEAVVRRAGKRVEDVPETQDYWISGPHANAKRSVLSGIVRTNGCKLVIAGGGLTNGKLKVYISGYKTDIENSKTLFVSALIFGQNHLISQLELAKRKYAFDLRAAKRAFLVENGRELPRYYYPKAPHGASFAPSFWLGFAATLTDRLSEANKAAENAATERVGNSVALALVDKKTAVEIHYRARWGKLGKGKANKSNSVAGYGAGQVAANRYNLNSGVGAGSRGALNS